MLFLGVPPTFLFGFPMTTKMLDSGSWEQPAMRCGTPRRIPCTSGSSTTSCLRASRRAHCDNRSEAIEASSDFEALGGRFCRSSELGASEKLGLGVLFGWLGSKIEGDSWFTRRFNHLPGKSIYFLKRTPMGLPPFARFPLKRETEKGKIRCEGTNSDFWATLRTKFTMVSCKFRVCLSLASTRHELLTS